MKLSLILPTIIATLALAGHAAAEPFRLQDYQIRVVPFLQKHCNGCHNAKEAEGELNLARFAKGEHVLASRKVWQKVARQLKAGAMPPDDKPRPPQKDVETVLTWIERALVHVDPTKPADPGKVTVRRLNRTEYNNTIRDLFGVFLITSRMNSRPTIWVTGSITLATFSAFRPCGWSST